LRNESRGSHKSLDTEKASLPTDNGELEMVSQLDLAGWFVEAKRPVFLPESTVVVGHFHVSRALECLRY
jgi:hypothetical protein